MDFFNDFIRNAHEQTHQGDPSNRLHTPIFGPDSDDPHANLNGFRPLPDDWAFNWRYCFPGLENAEDGRPLPQPSYKIDTSLSNPLGSLPNAVVPQPDPHVSLAERNLLRRRHLDLPSGQKTTLHTLGPVLTGRRRQPA